MILVRVDKTGVPIVLASGSFDQLLLILYRKTEKLERAGCMHINTDATPNSIRYEFAREEVGWCFALLIVEGLATYDGKEDVDSGC